MAKRTPRSTAPKGERISTDQAADRGLPETMRSQPGSTPSEDEIRLRAYTRYLERGGSDGRDLDDWVQAERELKSGV